MVWPAPRHSPSGFLWGTWDILFCGLVMLLSTFLCLGMGIRYDSTHIPFTTGSPWFFQLHTSCSYPGNDLFLTPRGLVCWASVGRLQCPTHSFIVCSYFGPKCLWDVLNRRWIEGFEEMNPWNENHSSPSSPARCWHGQKYDFVHCLALTMCTIRKAVEMLRERLTLNHSSFSLETRFYLRITSL